MDSYEFMCYLKWSKNKINHHPHVWMKVIRDEGKYDVVDAKERNQQQCRLSQSPETETEKKVKKHLTVARLWVHKGKGQAIFVFKQGLLLNTKTQQQTIIYPLSADKTWLQALLKHKSWHNTHTHTHKNLRVLIRFLPSDVGAVHFLSQYTDDADEEEKVHLPQEQHTLA